MRRSRVTKHAPGGRAVQLSLAAVLAAALGGCEDTSEPTPNQPPQTLLTGAPPDGARVTHHIEFLWMGSDQDGTVRDFDYILETHPRAVTSLGQVVVRQPQPDDARWTRLRANRVTLAVAADTLRADPRGDIGAGEFDRWHTFFLRAVDNEGAVDDTPEHSTFDAYTEAPRLWLVSPARAGANVTLPRTFVMNWDGSDPIGGPEPEQDPAGARWVLLPATLDGGGQPLGFPAALYDLPDSAWSDWAAWAGADSAGREAVRRDVVPGGSGQRAFVFAVQGRDDGGAVTPKYDATTARGNNYAVIVADGALPVGPRVTVHSVEDTLSAWTFDGVDAPQVNVTATTDTVTVFWDRPVASHYGARGRDSRYGWNIANPADDDEWTAWSTTVRTSPPRPLAPGGAVFRIQCRDHIGQVTSGVIVFQPAAGWARRPPAAPRP